MTQHTAQRHTPSRTAGFAHPERNVSTFGVEPGMSVADLGAGSGAYALALAARMNNTGRVYAVDIQRDLLRRIQNEARRRGLHNVEVIWADLERPGSTQIADYALDLVLVSNLLFQVEEKAALLAEARRILRAHGTLVVIDWNDSYGGLGPQRADIVKKDTVIALAREAGFEFVRGFDAGAHHYGIVFTEPSFAKL